MTLAMQNVKQNVNSREPISPLKPKTIMTLGVVIFQERLLLLVVLLNGTHSGMVKMILWVNFEKNQVKRARVALDSLLKEVLPSFLGAVPQEKMSVLQIQLLSSVLQMW